MAIRNGEEEIAGKEEMNDPMICQKCNVRPATEAWVGKAGAIAFLLGNSMQLCKICYLKAKIKDGEKLILKLKVWKKELHELTGV